jgi:hypothetical protein
MYTLIPALLPVAIRLIVVKVTGNPKSVDLLANTDLMSILLTLLVTNFSLIEVIGLNSQIWKTALNVSSLTLLVILTVLLALSYLIDVTNLEIDYSYLKSALLILSLPTILLSILSCLVSNQCNDFENQNAR